MRGMFAGEQATNKTVRTASDSVRSIDAALLADAIAAAISDGVAVLFAATRDGGAVVITVLDGDKRHKAYASNAGELLQAVTDLRASFK